MKLLVAVVLLCSTAYAETSDYSVVTIAIATTPKAEQEIVQSAYAKLGLPLAADTLDAPPLAPKHGGLAISVYAPRPHELHVVTYVGTDPTRALAVARAHFPAAHVEHLQLEETSLSDDYLSFSYADVLVLGAFDTYERAVAEARGVGALTKIDYDARGLVLRAGELVWPDDAEMDGGGYLPRRGGDCRGSPPFSGKIRAVSSATARAGRARSP